MTNSILWFLFCILCGSLHARFVLLWPGNLARNSIYCSWFGAISSWVCYTGVVFVITTALSSAVVAVVAISSTGLTFQGIIDDWRVAFVVISVALCMNGAFSVRCAVEDTDATMMRFSTSEERTHGHGTAEMCFVVGVLGVVMSGVSFFYTPLDLFHQLGGAFQ